MSSDDDIEAKLSRSTRYGLELLKAYDAKVSELLECEKAKNGAYSERNQLVAALSKLFPASLERHAGEDWEDDWRWVVFIELPAGQASWHIHDSELVLFGHLQRGLGRKWDGHSTPEKYLRLFRLNPRELPDYLEPRCNVARMRRGLAIPRSCELCAIGPCQCYPGNTK